MQVPFAVKPELVLAQVASPSVVVVQIAAGSKKEKKRNLQKKEKLKEKRGGLTLARSGNTLPNSV